MVERLYFNAGFHSNPSLNTTISLLLHWQWHFGGGVGRVVRAVGRGVVGVGVGVGRLGVVTGGSGGMYVLRGVVA